MHVRSSSILALYNRILSSVDLNNNDVGNPFILLHERARHQIAGSFAKDTNGRKKWGRESVCCLLVLNLVSSMDQIHLRWGDVRLARSQGVRAPTIWTAARILPSQRSINTQHPQVTKKSWNWRTSTCPCLGGCSLASCKALRIDI
jgi:hypothetical protein